MTTKYEEAQKRVTEKNPCGLTLRQRLKVWFWGTRVGVALHALMGRPTAYKLTVQGTLCLKSNSLIVGCRIYPPLDLPRLIGPTSECMELRRG